MDSIEAHIASGAQQHGTQSPQDPVPNGPEALHASSSAAASTPLERISALREILREHSRRYYVDNAPTISDYEFDSLMHELEALEAAHPEFDSPDSPTHKVGSELEKPVGANAESQIRSKFVQREHRYPMLSLGNSYSISEIEEFVARAERALDGTSFSYSCELKFDGTAICLSYTQGKLTRALTRGDGVKGDDVTANARRISNIPQQLSGDYPEQLEIRGEILMPYAAFDSLNQEREDAGEAPFANPRNAASGSLKLLDPKEVERRGLCCTLYHIPAESTTISSHSAALDAAASWGLPISNERRICHSISEIRDYINYWDIQRKFLPFATDGIVIKINELSSQRSLGYTAKSPRWAIAYKFKAEQACTPILSIDYQVGRTGAITPVANLEPVQLSGTVVKRATLNNADFISELDIHLGDWVYVEKGGEIIPKITGVNKALRSPSAERPSFPSHCPDCGSPIVRADDEAKYFCTNSSSCPTQIKGRIVHFVGRRAMDILAGEATVEQFYNAQILRSPADLYQISKYQLLSLEGWKDRAAERFLASVEKSKAVPFERVLFALGIRYVGETSAKTLARHFGSIEALSHASIDELLTVGDIGEVSASAIFDFFQLQANIDEISRLQAAGLQFASSRKKAASDALKGLSFVVSGTFSISRDALKELITSNGGKSTSSLSTSTSYLIAGEKPGPEKLRKCETLGIQTISEEEFRAMLPQGSDQTQVQDPSQSSIQASNQSSSQAPSQDANQASNQGSGKPSPKQNPTQEQAIQLSLF